MNTSYSTEDKINVQMIREFEQYLDGTIRRNEIDLSRFKTFFLRFVLYHGRLNQSQRNEIKQELFSRKHYKKPINISKLISKGSH